MHDASHSLASRACTLHGVLRTALAPAEPRLLQERRRPLCCPLIAPYSRAEARRTSFCPEAEEAEDPPAQGRRGRRVQYKMAALSELYEFCFCGQWLRLDARRRGCRAPSARPRGPPRACQRHLASRPELPVPAEECARRRRLDRSSTVLRCWRSLAAKLSGYRTGSYNHQHSCTR